MLYVVLQNSMIFMDSLSCSVHWQHLFCCEKDLFLQQLAYIQQKHLDLIHFSFKKGFISGSFSSNTCSSNRSAFTLTQKLASSSLRLSLFSQIQNCPAADQFLSSFGYELRNDRWYSRFKICQKWEEELAKMHQRQRSQAGVLLK